ncbi:hypothetical protein ACFWOG_04010 [Kitasatospora sp. NPDC058406]|uniref:hypothetical protein n=1 Tax=Kitasatospora sp. NPDC058406 TaxID=3346483 RepID=UPI00364CAABE
MTALDQLSSSLLARLYRRAEHRRWKGHSNMQIGGADVLADFHIVFKGGPTSEEDETVLTRCLDALVAADRVRLMARRANAPFPPGLHLLATAPAPVPAPRKEAPLHPALYRLVKGRRDGTERQRVAYTAISRWLHELPYLVAPDLAVPLRERALEIFGKPEYISCFPEPEKCLDQKGFGGPLFQDKAAFFELIRAFPTSPPLLSSHFSHDMRNRHTSLGAGDVLLVVENSATYTSLVRRLREVEGRIEHRIGCVAWGVGKSFKASVASIKDHHLSGAVPGHQEFSEIRYFGDLDSSGLDIPLQASARAVELELPPVRPTPVLYRELVRVGVDLPGKESSGPEDARRLVGWLDGSSDFEPVVEALVKGRRWAQEAVGLRHLTTTDDWISDMQ